MKKFYFIIILFIIYIFLHSSQARNSPHVKAKQNFNIIKSSIAKFFRLEDDFRDYVSELDELNDEVIEVINKAKKSLVYMRNFASKRRGLTTPVNNVINSINDIIEEYNTYTNRLVHIFRPRIRNGNTIRKIKAKAKTR